MPLDRDDIKLSVSEGCLVVCSSLNSEAKGMCFELYQFGM